MRRLTIISGIQIFPPLSGGNLRTASLARAFASQGYEVRVFSLTGRKSEYLSRQKSSTDSPADGVTEHVNRQISFGLIQFLTYRLCLPDLWHLVFSSRSPLLRRWISESDLIMVDFPFLHRYLARVPRGKRILNSHNLEHERWKKRGFLKRMVKSIERSAGTNADVVLATHHEEVSFYADTGARVALTPNGILDQRYDEETREKIRSDLGISEDKTVLLFSASQYGPNREGLTLLSEFEAAHREWLTQNGFVLLVVGSVSERPLRKGALIATGPVPVVEPYFSAADIALNPIESGSGTNLKMVQYLVARLPLVSTRFGARGFSLENGKDYIELDAANLQAALEIVKKNGGETLSHMADRAYQQNRHLIDMKSILRDSVLPLLLKTP